MIRDRDARFFIGRPGDQNKTAIQETSLLERNGKYGINKLRKHERTGWPLEAVYFLKEWNFFWGAGMETGKSGLKKKDKDGPRDFGGRKWAENIIKEQISTKWSQDVVRLAGI